MHPACGHTHVQTVQPAHVYHAFVEPTLFFLGTGLGWGPLFLNILLHYSSPLQERTDKQTGVLKMTHCLKKKKIKDNSFQRKMLPVIGATTSPKYKGSSPRRRSGGNFSHQGTLAGCNTARAVPTHRCVLARGWPAATHAPVHGHTAALFFTVTSARQWWSTQ